MNKAVRHYYDLAYEYSRAAALLWADITVSPESYNPTVSLLKHTVEMLLKGLIVKEQSMFTDLDYTGAAKIEINGDRVRMNGVTSLAALWRAYKRMSGEMRLCPVYDNDQKEFIDRVIRKSDVPDSDAFSVVYVKEDTGEGAVTTLRDVKMIGERKMNKVNDLFKLTEMLFGFFR